MFADAVVEVIEPELAVGIIDGRIAVIEDGDADSIGFEPHAERGKGGGQREQTAAAGQRED